MNAAWDSLLGLPLDSALERARAWGCEPRVVTTGAPRRRDARTPAEDTYPRTLRVIRVREGELTVSAFQDGEPSRA